MYPARPPRAVLSEGNNEGKIDTHLVQNPHVTRTLVLGPLTFNADSRKLGRLVCRILPFFSVPCEEVRALVNSGYSTEFCRAYPSMAELKRLTDNQLMIQ